MKAYIYVPGIIIIYAGNLDEDPAQIYIGI